MPAALARHVHQGEMQGEEVASVAAVAAARKAVYSSSNFRNPYERVRGGNTGEGPDSGAK